MPSIPQLQQRYGLSSRQSVYNRIEHLEKLGLERDLEEQSRFLRELDSLHVYLQQKGAQMEGYTLDGQTARVQVLEASNGRSSGLDKPTGQLPHGDLLTLLEAIAARLSPTPIDPLLPQRQLQEVCDRGWLLSTSQLSVILGTRPRTAGDRYGFTLQRVGRMGREGAWSVKRCAASSHQLD